MEGSNEARVLVVDDDKHAVEILYRLLEKEGFAVLRAQSGREALAVVAAEKVDVILLDVMMPEMDGFEVCSALRAVERTRDIPVILLTAKDDVETRVPSSKLARFLSLASDLKEGGHRALVFSQFTSHLALVRESLDAIGTTGTGKSNAWLPMLSPSRRSSERYS